MNVHSMETINKIKVKWNLFKENTTTKLINKHQRKAIRETRDGFRKQTSLQINVFNFLRTIQEYKNIPSSIRALYYRTK